MKRKLLLFLLMVYAITGWAQINNQNEYSVSINGHRINTTANFKQQVEQLRKSADKQSTKSKYTLLQFSKIPTLEEQKELSKQGITLISYLSNNAYYVSIDSKYYNQSSVSKNIRTAIAIESSFKIDPIIVSGEIPDYAQEGNAVKVVVSYFKGADSGIISSELGQLNVKGFKVLESFDQVYVNAPMDKLSEIAKLNWVQNIELIGPPVESDNLPGVTSHKVNVLNSAIPGIGYDLSGKGVKIGIWDGNLEKHIDHTGRVTTREYESASSHGEHVSGTIGGAGVLDPRAKGMAPEVQMFGWNFNTQSNGLPVYMERDLAATNDGVELTSNSYGVNLTSGYNTTRYGVSDRGDDDVTVKHPFLLNVYSNGNAQSAYAGGFNTSTKASKNALHVAANNPDDLISSYSSFGPTLDGRLVPQISAVGSSVYSLDYSNSYQIMSGTSMATPGTSGTIVLLYERYKNIYGTKPLASLMKALVSNTAKDNGNPGPDYKYGFGNLNGLRAVKVLDNKMFYTAAVANGASYEKEIVVPAGLTTLKVMLAYSDIGATPGVTDILVNNLDIKLVKDGVTTLPWILDATQPDANAKRGVDNLNNIEQITIDNPTAGTYKIIVTGTVVPLNTQEFSVVYDYVAPELVLTYPVGGEKFNPDATEYIRWDYEGEEKNFNIEYSNDGGLTYSVIASNVPSAARNFAWTVPSGPVPNAKIRISAGSKVDVSTQSFAIMSEPKNLVFSASVCGVTTYKLDWDAIAGAKYEVLKLNGYKFEVVATTTDPTYTFNNLPVGDNNWFTVRAVDLVTGLASERARAVNVEPIDKPVLTALNLPYKENFNDRKPTNYTLTKASATGTIGYESTGLVSLDAVKMSGSSVAGSPLWVASTTATAFTNNPNYIKRLSFCEIDASSLTGKSIRMKFDVILQNSVTTNKNFFRVLVNGVPLTSGEGTTVYAGTLTATTRTLTYNLAAYAGTKFNVVFEGVMDNDATSAPAYNTAYVDNVEFFEATASDLALTALTANVGLTATETVSVKVYNFSPTAVSNVPVSYKLNQGTTVNETIAGPIAPLSEVTYSFTQKADYSTPGLYTVLASVNLAGDAETSNNSLTKTVVNTGTDVLMTTGNSTTCNAVFTDSGSRFGDYANSLNQTYTFKPTAGNAIKVDFVEFATEQDYDFLEIYNGASTSAPLVGRYHGNALPPSFTSTSIDGNLTFKFTSDNVVVDKGWIANITCVTKPVIIDYAMVSFIAPDVLGKKTNAQAVTIRVINNGSAAATNVPVFYKIDNQTKVTAIIPSLASGVATNYTFATTADLSTINASYSINAGIDVADDNLTNNTLTRVVYNVNDVPTHTNTNGFAITKLKWGAMVNSSGTTAYSNFKSIKIPVYAGFTYQPEVTIIKPERPITRDLSTTPGVFTMIVIDLNGDGNLTDEFNAGTFWVNTLNTATAPAIASTTSVHSFRNNFTLVGGVTIPAATTAGEKLMRVIHMFRSPSEYFNVNLGPTIDGVTMSREDFEVEEYTINVLPFTAANASIESIAAPVKTGMKPVTVSAVIRNFSNVAIANFPVAYSVNGGPEVIQNQVASIAAGGTTTITFTTKADLGPVGDYTIQVYTKLVGDTDPTNDAKSITLSHVANATPNVTGTFDGVDDYMVTDVNPALELSNNYTFEAWVNRKSPTVFGRIYDKSRVNLFVHTNNSLSIYKENSLVLSIAPASGTSYVINTGLNSVQLNKWHHIAFTVSSANVYTIYIDGVAVPYTSTGTPIAAGTNAALPAYIGGNATLTRGLNGNIDEVRIWSGVRSQATIVANAMTKYVGNEAGLLAYYSFAEGNKQFVYDTTTSDNTAVVYNADTNGLGEGKFWNTPVLLQSLQLKDQLSSTYNAATKTYTVLLKDGINVTTAIPEFIAGMNSVVKINGVVQVSGVTPNNLSNPVTFTVEGVGFNAGITETYTLKVLTGLSNESKLLSYNFKMSSNPGLTQDINTAIVGDNASATVPYGIDVKNIKADFSVSPGAELVIDNVVQLSSKTSSSDYSNSVMVTVVSENKLSKTNYMVTVNAKNTEAKFISYTVQNQIGAATIDQTAKTVKVIVNNNANLNALVPSFQVSENAKTRIGTYIQNSGVTPLNYTSKVGYNILAENGNINNWELTIERAKPVITLLGNAIVSVPQGCTYTEPGYSAIDNLNKVITSSVVVSGSVNISVIGQYVLTYTVKDDLNNESFITRTVNVVANQKPVITAAANINVNSASTFCGAVVVVANATATDDCSVGTPTGLRSDGLALNANYPIGITSIKWNVSDNLGNAANEVIQTVTVVDNVLPTVITKNITVQLNASGSASIVAADVNNGSTDNCGIATISVDKTSFNCSNVGANTITLRVTDVNGNVATKTATVTVEDKIAPTVFTKNITVQLGASSNILITAADVNNGSTDNCGIKSLELDKALFSCGNVGDNIVTLKVTDNSGNVSTKTAVVTVVNTRPNIIRKHFDNVIFFDNSSREYVAYSWYKNGVLVAGQTAQYFKDSGVLNGTYYAIAIKTDGTAITTCDLTFSASKEEEYLKIAPNPVKSNSSYQIFTNVDSAKLQNARITVFNTLGMLISDKVVTDKTTEMIAPTTEGIYIVKMTLANGKYFTKNLLVKN